MYMYIEQWIVTVCMEYNYKCIITILTCVYMNVHVHSTVDSHCVYGI